MPRSRLTPLAGHSTESVEEIPGLRALWSRTLGDERICIAVLDGPADRSHPSFGSARLTTVDTLTAVNLETAAGRHGTHVTSVIFGQHGGPVTGIAPGCRGVIIPVFGTDAAGRIIACSQLDLARAIRQAIQAGAHVINVSGGQLTSTGVAHALLADAVRHCAAQDVLLVAAAGNDGCDCLHIPAVLPSLLAVGAMNARGEVLEFSNWGAAYTPQAVLALGENVLGAIPGGGLERQSGTSYATAIVSGVAGLLLSLQLQQGQSPSPHAVRKAILDNALLDNAIEGRYTSAPIGRINIPATVGTILKTSGVLAMPDQGDERQEQPGNVILPAVAETGASTPPNRTQPVPDVVAEVGAAGSLVGGQVKPSCGCGCGKSVPAQPVYALGQLGYDFGTEARRDSFVQLMGPSANPHNSQQLLDYLDKNPWEASSIIWTLNLDATAIYALKPDGAFASDSYERLRVFLREQLTDGVDRVSMPGMVVGNARLFNGQVVPVIHPAIRGMYNWTTKALVEAVAGPAPARNASKSDREAYERKTRGLASFLERVYHELRNMGMLPQERAINYAATNAFSTERIFEASLGESMELERIDVDPSPICRPESDCWDVRLTFFDPGHVFARARKVYRFTVDVSDLVPVTVGPVRSWSVR
jgi:cyanobactin maturation PatA/PatG family protease